LRKVFTTRLWWGLLTGLVLAWAGLSVLLGALSGLDTGNGQSGPGVDDPATVRTVLTAGLGTAYLFALAFGVIAMAGEFRQQTITATLLTSPHRSRVVLAKLAVVALVGLGYGLAGVIAGLIGGVPVLLIRGSHVALTGHGIPRALAAATVAVALWAVLGLGVGTLIRNQIVALLVSIGVAWIAEPIIAFGLNAAGAGGVARFLPSQATSALVSPAATNGGVTTSLLPWWAGALVLLAYAVLSGALGAALTLRRDVT
jgi:ABC-type transport system involved in multi-copper enzyme maturation permease subunit